VVLCYVVNPLHAVADTISSKNDRNDLPNIFRAKPPSDELRNLKRYGIGSKIHPLDDSAEPSLCLQKFSF
jgi:hypothetical protein